MSNEHDCHVLRQLVAVRMAGKTEREGAEFLAAVQDIDGVTGLIAETGADPYQGAVQERVAGWWNFPDGYLNRRIAILTVEEGQEHSVAALVRDGALQTPASPVHALGRLNHISKMPGRTPVAADPPASKPHLPPPGTGRAIAVVDSGITKDIPAWLADGLVYDDAEDLEDLAVTGEQASHGVFVTGLIRRIAPEHTIHFARAPSRPIEDFTNGANPPQGQALPPGSNPTTEIDVGIAITRLVERLDRIGADPGLPTITVDALNLSLGGTRCPENDPVLAALEEAIDFWRTNFAETEVFAAGGNRMNENEENKVYPAAFPGVRGVGAATDGGGDVVWDDNEVSQPFVGTRSWITDVAPGESLTGPSGVATDEWVEWSGSSFATAVVAASHASRRRREVIGGINYWPDAGMNYADSPI